MARIKQYDWHSTLHAWVFYVVSALLLCVLLSIGKLNAADELTAEPITDLRILVDVSGSMKKNDPKNLRRDALRLLIGMLPENSRVGIWSFGQYVNMQVKPDFATKAWKNNARKEANTIHSRGLYTNIQDTLTKSSWDWRRPDPKWDRHMILLTDGMVDISKDQSKNNASRQKILGNIVSGLNAANVKIHTIALSKQADHDLLKKLSTKTGGWYESVKSADMLQRLFLRLFEKTTKMDSLPLEGNLFDVDDSISDMTLLVFRSASGKKTKILMPDHSVLEYAKPTKNVEWFQDKSFDIITIHKPIAGKWKLDADVDKDNRVKIISNLKLRVDPLPIDIIESESVNLKAAIFTKQGLLDDKDILNLTKVTVHSVGYSGKETTQTFLPSNQRAKYEGLLEGVSEKGTVQIVVKVDSPTFKRESRHEIKVHQNPVKLTLSATTAGLVINIEEDPLLLQTGTLQLALQIEGNKGAYHITKFGAHRWQAILDNSFSGKSITINATANRIGNIPFTSQLHSRLPEAIKPIKDPLTVWSEEVNAGLVIKVRLEENLLQTGTLALSYYTQGHEQQTITITQKSDKIWQQLLLPEHTGTTINVVAAGHQLDGEKFNKLYKVTIPELKVKVEEPAHEEAPAHEKAPEQEHVDEEKHDSEEDMHAADADKHEAETEEETNTTLVIILLVVANIIIFGGAYFGYRYWQKKNKPLEDDLDDDSSDDSDGAETSSADEPEPTSKDSSDDEPSEKSDKKDNDKEDFSDQRKEPATPENIDLEVDEKADSEADSADSADETPELIDTASADDLPDFDVDLESELTDESTQEKKDE